MEQDKEDSSKEHEDTSRATVSPVQVPASNVVASIASFFIPRSLPLADARHRAAVKGVVSDFAFLPSGTQRDERLKQQRQEHTTTGTHHSKQPPPRFAKLYTGITRYNVTSILINEKTAFAFDRYFDCANAVTGFLDANLTRVETPDHLLRTICAPGCVQLIAWVTSTENDPEQQLTFGDSAHDTASTASSAVTLPATAIDMEQLCAALSQVAPGLPAHSVQVQFGLPLRFAPLPVPTPSHTRSTSAVDIVEVLPPCFDLSTIGSEPQELMLHVLSNLHEELQPLRVLVIGQHGELLLEEDISLKIQEESQIVRLRLPPVPAQALTGDRGISTLRLLLVPALSGLAPREGQMQPKSRAEADQLMQERQAVGGHPPQPSPIIQQQQEQQQVRLKHKQQEQHEQKGESSTRHTHFPGQGTPQAQMQHQQQEWQESGGGPTPHLSAVSTPVRCTLVYGAATILVAPPPIARELCTLWQELLRAAHVENRAALQAIAVSDGGELPPSTLHAAEVSGAIQRQQEPSQQQQELSATAEPAPAVSPVTDNGDEQQAPKTTEDVPAPVSEPDVAITAATWSYHFQQLIHDLAMVHAPGVEQQQDPRSDPELDPSLYPVPGAFSAAGPAAKELLNRCERHLCDYVHTNGHLLPEMKQLLSQERHPRYREELFPEQVVRNAVVIQNSA